MDKIISDINFNFLKNSITSIATYSGIITNPNKIFKKRLKYKILKKTKGTKNFFLNKK